MQKYVFRDICAEDYSEVARIYNSNRYFLQNHLGMDAVDRDFIAEEVRTMQNLGFRSVVVEENGLRCALLDYRPGSETYLSLLMLPSVLQGKGMGKDIYACFEAQMKEAGCSVMRIDIVNDYPQNLLPFWKKIGFKENESVTLEWGKKRSGAVVMRKKSGGK